MSRMSKHALSFFMVLATAAMILVSGCQQPAEKKDDAKDVVEVKQGTPLLEFEGGSITVEEFKPIIEQMKKQVAPQQRDQFQNPANIRNLLTMLSEKMILADEAKKADIISKPGIEGIIDISKNEALTFAYIYNVLIPEIEGMEIPEEELLAFYDQNIRLYDESKVQASHILVATREEADAVYKAVKKAPETFADVAKKKSIDKSNSENGGDLGWFGKGNMVKPFEDAAFSMEPGQISEPVETKFGWHIIFLQNKSETGLKPFEDVRDDVRTKMIERNKNEYIRKKVMDLKESKNIQIHDENIPLLFGEAAAPAPGSAPGAPPVNPHAGGNTPPPPPPVPTPAPAPAE